MSINAGYGRRMARHVCRELDSGDGERGYGDRDYEERIIRREGVARMESYEEAEGIR